MRHGSDLTPDERAQWIKEGQRWFDSWQEAGYPYDEEAIRRAYDLAGMSQSMNLAAYLKGRDEDGFRCAMMLADLAVEEADEIAERWSSEHDGEQYHSFVDAVEFIAYDVMVNGSFANGRTEAIDMLDWHHPNIADAYMVKGSLCYDQGNYEESLKWHLRAIDVDPVCALVLLEVAECHKKLGNMEEGLEYAKRALRFAWQMPVVAKARRTIAFCEGELGHYDLCAANLVISNDYEQSPLVAQELLWLRHQGWTGSMPLDRALELAPEETEDTAVSVLIQEALMGALKLTQETESEDRMFLLDLMTNVLQINREGRHNPAASDLADLLL